MTTLARWVTQSQHDKKARQRVSHIATMTSETTGTTLCGFEFSGIKVEVWEDENPECSECRRERRRREPWRLASIVKQPAGATA